MRNSPQLNRTGDEVINPAGGSLPLGGLARDWLMLH